MKENVINQVSEIIREELLKRGINVLVTGRDTKHGTEFTSSEFQTIPVLFKKNSIHAWSEETEENENGVKEIYIQVSVNYVMFEGGSNGFKLFDMVCGWDSKTERAWLDRVR